MPTMDDRVISQKDLEYLESLLTVIVHLTMTMPADKLEALIGVFERQEAILALGNPSQFLQLTDRFTRGGRVAKAVLKFRRELEAFKETESEER